jgi:hypothetical protein
VAEEVEARAAVHLSHDPFGAGVDAFGPSVVVREGEVGVDGCPVEFETVRKGVEVGQLGPAAAVDPRGSTNSSRVRARTRMNSPSSVTSSTTSDASPETPRPQVR